MNFTVPANHSVKLKKSKKQDYYRDFARELTKVWNIKMPVIPKIVGRFGANSNILKKSLEHLKMNERIETSHTTVLLRLARSVKRVLVQ